MRRALGAGTVLLLALAAACTAAGSGTAITPEIRRPSPR